MNRRNMMSFSAIGAQMDAHGPQNKNALFVAEMFNHGSADDTTGERLSDANGIRIRPLPDFIPTSSPALSC